MEVVLKYFSEFTEKQLEQFTALEGLYSEWNEKINVISRKDIESLYLKHVLHSLTIAAVIDFRPGTQIIDIGTGGGFPGIPLAIYFPEVQFHLVDSIAKKLKVVQGVADAVGLTNVTVQHTRAEEIKGRKFDFAVSRAVAPLKELLQWSNPLVKKGGTQELANGLICLKGGDLAQEISESGARPRMTPVKNIFPEEGFEEKFLLHVPR
ncbi:16S rRNA (guanine527-N7)-methyltransferase [Filimonas zeae]|uniref:Ribosomal RNA small subunit methyltransferase G n=1 Tax=Filimonas zeae TaxID=1737353 RepID=A0A917MRP3_9BACT|nr:16S rRNA (guanine(527)-N(7))-methyltransferase RsmG [Filimonas zeae]MDR6337012.1 16S rRNA (guanine527-N7)-methyltransferase [Filimonas zeae]GGH56579.1 ribosomal RNA small subunit methyltransferase G [Filimonas zeae]